MEILDCLLDAHNPRIIDGASIGNRVAAQGKKCLWGARPGCGVDVVVIHYISAMDDLPADPFNTDAILAIFCNRIVSAHYLIDRDGSIVRLVPEEALAWHAGGSIMPGTDRRIRVNDFSIGIELVATRDSGYTMEQYESASWLAAGITRRHGRAFTMVGHEEIAGEQAVRLGLRGDLKEDPGPLFNWGRFLTQTGEKGGTVLKGQFPV